MRSIVLQEADKSRFIKKFWNDAGCNGVDCWHEYDLQTTIDFFNKHQEIKVDWQSKKTNIMTLWNIMLDYSSNQTRRNLKSSNPDKIFDGTTIKVVHTNENWIFAIPSSWEDCQFMDSYKCGGTGAKWCIGYAQDKRHWRDYVAKKNCMFCLALERNTREKFMLQFSNINLLENQAWVAEDDPSKCIPKENWPENFGIDFDTIVVKVAENWNPLDLKDKLKFKKEQYIGDNAFETSQLTLKELKDYRRSRDVAIIPAEVFTLSMDNEKNDTDFLSQCLNLTTVLLDLSLVFADSGITPRIVNLDFKKNSVVRILRTNINFSKRLEADNQWDSNTIFNIKNFNGSFEVAAPIDKSYFRFTNCNLTRIYLPPEMIQLPVELQSLDTKKDLNNTLLDVSVLNKRLYGIDSDVMDFTDAANLISKHIDFKNSEGTLKSFGIFGILKR